MPLCFKKCCPVCKSERVLDRYEFFDSHYEFRHRFHCVDCEYCGPIVVECSCEAEQALGGFAVLFS